MLSPADIRILTALYKEPATPLSEGGSYVARSAGRRPQRTSRSRPLTSLGKDEVLAKLLYPGPDDGPAVRPASR